MVMFVSGFITAGLLCDHGLLVGAFASVTKLSGAALFRLVISSVAAVLGGIVGVDLCWLFIV